MGHITPAQSGTSILAGALHVGYINRIREQDRPGGAGPATGISEEITLKVANGAPYGLRLPDMAGRDTCIMPESERWDEIRRVHRTNAQDMGVEMGRGLRMLMPIQR